MCSHRIN